MLGPRMCINGLIEQEDISGIAAHALTQRSLVPAPHHGAKPRRALQDLYKAGHLLRLSLSPGLRQDFLVLQIGR